MGPRLTARTRKGVSEMTGVMLTIENAERGYPQRFTFECHSPERLAEIVEGTYAAMSPTERLTEIHVR